MNISLASRKTTLHRPLYTKIFKQTVNHYRQNGSHVFACFIDFNKAFDNVDFWLLFCKLIDNNNGSACCVATRLLAYWYGCQQLFVSWQNQGRSLRYASYAAA